MTQWQKDITIQILESLRRIWPGKKIGSMILFGVRKVAGGHVMIKSPTAPNKEYLSIHYWNDWAHKSSSGDGWIVTSTNSVFSCHPSIVVPGYHGWFTNGTFSSDLEGQGPTGISKPLPEGLLPCK